MKWIAKTILLLGLIFLVGCKDEVVVCYKFTFFVGNSLDDFQIVSFVVENPQESHTDHLWTYDLIELAEDKMAEKTGHDQAVLINTERLFCCPE